MFVVKGNVGHLTANGIDKITGQPVGQETREQQVFMGILPDFGLIGANPVDLCFLLQIGNGFRQTGNFKDQSPEAADRRQPVGFTLIQPHHGRTQGLTVFIDVNHTSALGG